MKLLLRFNSLSSLVRYLNDELNKLKAAKNALEKTMSTNRYFEMISVDDNGEVKVDRADINEVKPILDDITNKIEIMSNMLNEITKIMNDNDYIGTVYLEYENGYPTRIIISQPVVMGS